MENRAGELQLLSKPKGIDQIAVMRQGQRAFAVIDHNGLGVIPVRGAGGAVAHMAHSHVPRSQPGQRLRCEYVLYQPEVLVGGYDAVVAYRNAAALLAPVLQGKQAVVRRGGDLPAFPRVNAENAALLSQLLD